MWEEGTVGELLMEIQPNRKAGFDSNKLSCAALAGTHELLMHHCAALGKFPYISFAFA